MEVTLEHVKGICIQINFNAFILDCIAKHGRESLTITRKAWEYLLDEKGISPCPFTISDIVND